MKTKHLFLACILSFFVYGFSINKQASIAKSDKSGNIKALLLCPANLGANFNYNLDIIEEYGWEITTAAITNTVTPCPWGVSVGLQAFTVDTLISEINDINNYDIIAIMPSSWQAVTSTQAYLDLLNDTHCKNLIQSAYLQNKVIWATCAGSRLLAASNIINGVHVQGKSPFIAEIQSAGGIYMSDTSLPIIESNIITCAKDMWYCYQNTEAIATVLENNTKNKKNTEQRLQIKQTNINLNRGEVEWSYTYGAAFSEGIKAMCTTVDNGYALVGNTFSTGACYSNVLFIKTDTSGNLLCLKTYGGTGFDYAYDIQTGSHGGYIIAGYTTSFGAGGKDFYLIKTDEFGNLIWSKTYGGTGLDVARSVVETSDNHYLILGYTESFDRGKGDIYLVKTDSSGNICWTKTFGGSNAEMARKVRIANDGKYIILGTTGSKGAGKSDYNLIKTDTSGNIIWDKTYGTADYQEAFDVIQTADKGYAIVGHSDIHSTDLNQIYLVKADSNGIKKWTKFYGSSYGFYDYGRSLIELPNKNILICGNTKKKTDRKNDVWIVITDANGNMLWNDIYGGMLSDLATAIIPTYDGGFVFAGQTESFNSGNFDAWLVKISNPALFINDEKQTLTRDPLQIMPNPFNAFSKISVFIPSNKVGTITIIDISGKIIKVFPDLKSGVHILDWNGTNNENIPIDSGIYFIKLQLPEKNYVKKILKS